MKIGIIDDGLEADHPYFNPAGLHLSARVPEGPDAIHDAEGDRPADVRTPPRRPTSTRTRRSTRPSRSTRRTSRASPPAIRHLSTAQTISGVAPQAYLGNYKALTIPTPGLRARRQQRRDRRRHRRGGRGRHERDQPVARRARGRAAPRPRRAGDQRRRRSRRRPGRRRRATTSTTSATARSRRPGTRPARSPSPPSTRPAASPSFSSAGPTPVSLAMKPDVAAPGRQRPLVAPRVAGNVRAPERDEHGDAARRRRRRAAQGAPSDLDGPADQVGTRADRRPGATRRRGGEALAIREGGGIVDLPRADTPLLFADPTRLSFGRLAAGRDAHRSPSRSPMPAAAQATGP